MFYSYLSGLDKCHAAVQCNFILSKKQILIFNGAIQRSCWDVVVVDDTKCTSFRDCFWHRHCEQRNCFPINCWQHLHQPEWIMNHFLQHICCIIILCLYSTNGFFSPWNNYISVKIFEGQYQKIIEVFRLSRLTTLHDPTLSQDPLLMMMSREVCPRGMLMLMTRFLKTFNCQSPPTFTLFSRN